MAASSIIGALRVNLGLDSALFSRGLRESMGSLRGFAAFAGKALAGASIAFAGAATAMGAAAVQAGGEIDRLAKVSNAAPVVFQKWAAAASTVGIQQDKLADILKDVNDRVGDFLNTGGGPMADFFEQIAPKVGVTAEMFKDLSGPQALQLYVNTLERAGVNQQEMTFYLEAMASDLTMMLPLLKNGGSEIDRLGTRAAKLGAIMDDKAVASMVRIRAAMAEASTAMSGLGNAVGVVFAPLMESSANATTRFAEAITQSMQEGGLLRGVLEGIIAGIRVTGSIISGVTDAFSALANNLHIVGQALLVVAATRVPALIAGLVTLNWTAALTSAGFLVGATAARAMAAAQLAMAAASRGLAAALALAGGPIGLLVGAATALGFALYSTRSRATEVAASIREVTDAQGELNQKVDAFYRTQDAGRLEAAMAQAREDIAATKEALKAAIEELNREKAWSVNSLSFFRSGDLAGAQAAVDTLSLKVIENESLLSSLEHAWSRISKGVSVSADQVGAMTAEQIKAHAAAQDLLRSYERAGELKKIENTYGRDSVQYLALQHDHEREILAARLQTMDVTEDVRGSILNALDANQSAEAATHRWAAAMAGVGAQIRGIAAALASIGGGMIDNASKFVELNALKAGKSSAEARRTAEYDRQDKELAARSAAYRSNLGDFAGGIISMAEKGVIARGRLLDAELEAEHAAAAEREKIAGGGKGGGKSKEKISDLEKSIKPLNDELSRYVETLGMTDLQADIWAKQRDAGVEAASAQGQQIANTMTLIDRMKGLKDATEQWRDSMKGAFASFVTGASSFKDMLGQIIGKLAEMLANSAFDKLFTGFGGNGLVGSFLGLLGFDGGGYTGSGPRSGGLDGKGGFLAMMHPQETVIDHTKGQSYGGGGSTRVEVIPSPYFNTVVDGRIQRASPAIIGGSVQATQRAARKSKTFFGGR